VRHWARRAVEEALSRGWLELCESDGPDFLPDARVTRAEAAAIVNRMIGRAADLSYMRSRGSADFYDVPRDFWAYSDISEASVDHDFVTRDGAEFWTSVR
jgi:hypothetical protein